MTKARDLANLIAAGNPLADGTVEVADISDLTATAAELNTLDGVTADVNELNVLDGVTASTAELNTLDGVTADVNELNVLDGVTASTAELNILDGATTSTAELNKLDGVTVGTTEFNYLTGASSNLQPQIDAVTLTPQVITSDTTAVAGNTYYLDADGITLTLPSSPSTGDLVGVSEIAGGETSVITSSDNIMSSSNDILIDAAYTRILLKYVDATIGWAFT